MEEFLREMGLLAKPVVLTGQNGQWKRSCFDHHGTFTIGRVSVHSQMVIKDRQVSRLHCKISYDSSSGDFLVENYSRNRTYTSRGTLEKGQRVSLSKGEWLYIQTSRKRYVFYMEVE